MSEDEAMDWLEDSQILIALRWAAPWAFARTGEDYDEAAGHSQVIIGIHNHTYLCDLMDRATTSKRYALAADAASIGIDILSGGIPKAAFDMMPSITEGSIVRSDYKQSPGWKAGDVRIILQSFKSGYIDRINWSQKSAAKEEVATQHFIGGLTLFDDDEMGISARSGIVGDDKFSGVTLVIAHCYNPVAGEWELWVGQSKNPLYPGDAPWHWRRRIAWGGIGMESAAPGTTPTHLGGAATTDVDDVIVQARTRSQGEASGTGNA